MNHGLDHLLKRRRMSAVRAYDSLMLIVSVGAPLTLLPQIIQVFENKNVAGLSLLTWGLLASVNFLWAIYGYIHREQLILLANLLMGVLDLVVALEIILYR
jgi:uncharacterized protein with PQ loop repeat